MRLGAILGQPHAIRCITTALASGQPAHGWFFWGPPGTGKRTAALAFARALNCESPAADRDACGACDPCKAIEGGFFPEVRMFGPEDDSGKARSFHTDTITEAIHWAVRTAHVKRTKVGILEDAHLMSHEAANHFLKMLEEPPPRTVWILLAPDRHSILTTLYSRCLPVRFTLLSREAIEGILRLRAAGKGAAASIEEAPALAMGRLDVPLEEVQEAVKEAEEYLGLAARFDLAGLEARVAPLGKKEGAERLPVVLDGLERACGERLRLHPEQADTWIEALDAVARARWRHRQSMGKTLPDALAAELCLACASRVN